MTCCTCQRLGKSERLSHGWKRLGETIYCEKCWQQRYSLRSIALPVVEPMGENWAVFREALKNGWAEATAAANWIMTELYARDVRRNGEEKMPRMSRVYLYPEARLRFPRLASQTVVSIENHVQGAYRSVRYELLWTPRAAPFVGMAVEMDDHRIRALPSFHVEVRMPRGKSADARIGFPDQGT